MKTWIKNALRRFGDRLSAVGDRLSALEYDCPAHPRFDQHDLDEAIAVIERHVKADGSLMTWDRSRKYLDPWRVYFYHAVLDVLESTGALRERPQVLDIGVYFGYLLRIIHKHHPTADYHGAETNATPLAIAKELCPFANISHATIDSLDDSRAYDVVLLTEVLEHLVHPEQALHRLASFSKMMPLTVPDGRMDTTQAMQFNRQWGSYRGHINFWSPESWQNWLMRELPDHEVRTGKLPTKMLYAIVRGNGQQM